MTTDFIRRAISELLQARSPVCLWEQEGEEDPMAKEDVVIAVAGAALILVVLAGVYVVENREGARDHEIAPVQHLLRVQGEHSSQSASGTQGPQGTCVPEIAETECRSARFVLDLAVDGLPSPPAGGHYAAFLRGEGRSLGPLQEEAGKFLLEVDEGQDATGSQEIQVLLVEDPVPQDHDGIPLFVWSFTARPEETPFDETVEARLSGSGWARTSQTGAVTIATLVDAGLDDVPPGSPWSLHAWFVDDSTTPPTFTHLGVFEQDPDGEWVLGVRKERVRVEDQTRFLVTLEDEDLAVGGQPGWLAYEARLRET